MTKNRKMVILYRLLTLALTGHHFQLSVGLFSDKPSNNSKATYSPDVAFMIAVEKQFCLDDEKTWLTCPQQFYFDKDSSTLDANVSGLPVHPPEEPSSSCCIPCSCQMDCIRTDNCCPEMIDHIPKAVTETVCIQPQIRAPGAKYKNSPYLFFMIRGCSISPYDQQFSNSVRQMCEHADDYKEFEVNVPVSNIHSRATYVNRYCAICNGIAEENMTYWIPELTCVNGDVPKVSIETVVEEVKKTNTCNVVMKMPDSANLSVTKCSSYISSCNVTGLVTHYDPIIEEACKAYTHIYDYMYKNVFCYICNTEDDIGKSKCKRPNNIISSVPILVSFSALLRFRPGEASTNLGYREAPECDPHQVYDAYKEVCRNITCFPPRVLQGNVCTNPFESISGVSYRFFLKLTPVEIIELDEFLPIDGNIYKDVVGPSMQDLWEYTSLRSFVKENDSDETTAVTLDYYLVQIDIIIPINKYVNQSIIEDIIKLNNQVQKKIYRHDHIIRCSSSFIMAHLVRVDDCFMYDTVKDEILIEVQPGRPKPDDNDPGIPIGNGQRHKRAVDNTGIYCDNDTFLTDDGDDNQDDTEESLNSKLHFEVVIPPMFCPLVALSSEEFYFIWYSGGVYVENLETNISRNNYVNINEIAENSSIFICKSFFLNITQTLLLRYPRVGTKQTYGAQGLLSLVCTCLSIVCSILTLITYILFKELRTQPGLNNIMLISSLICAQLLFQFGIGQAQNVSQWVCRLIGALIHFSWLLTLMWMNVCSLHMFRVFKTLTKISSSASMSMTTVTYLAYCLSIAIVPVVINIALNNDNMGYGGELCYITNYTMNLYLFLLPVAVIVLFNISIFIGVIITISKMPKIDGNVSKNRNFAKIYLKLSSITGMTWMFGFIFALTEEEVFDYIFIIFNAGLGVFIFLSFVCNKRVLTLYTRARKQNLSKYVETTNTKTFSETQSDINTGNSK